jgi:hypothetical protein
MFMLDNVDKLYEEIKQELIEKSDKYIGKINNNKILTEIEQEINYIFIEGKLKL